MICNEALAHMDILRMKFPVFGTFLLVFIISGCGQPDEFEVINNKDVAELRSSLSLPQEVSDQEIEDFFDSVHREFGKVRDVQYRDEYARFRSEMSEFSVLVAIIHRPDWNPEAGLYDAQFLDFVHGQTGAIGMRQLLVEPDDQSGFIVKGIAYYTRHKH